MLWALPSRPFRTETLVIIQLPAVLPVGSSQPRPSVELPAVTVICLAYDYVHLQEQPSSHDWLTLKDTAPRPYFQFGTYMEGQPSFRTLPGIS